jgi:hypothetical protein
MSNKPFCPEQYDADDNCKHDVIRFLEAQTWARFDLVVNRDQYGIDLVGECNGYQCGVEVEIKHSWSGQHFPFKNVHIAARKVKFIECKPYVFYVIVNAERTQALIVTPESLDNIMLVKKPTVHTTTEWFMQVPLDDCDQYQL